MSKMHKISFPSNRVYSVWRLVILLPAAFFLQSCSHKLWYANDPVILGNVKKQGDLNVSGGSKNAHYSRGTHLQCSYATSDYHFVMASYTEFAFSGKTKKTSPIKGRACLFGLGYYQPLAENLFIELGAGARYAEKNNSLKTEYASANQLKVFVQPGFTFISKYFELGLGARAGVIRGFSAGINNPSYTQEVGRLPRFIEPALSFAAGFRRVKFGTQLSISYVTIPYPSDLDPLSFSFFVRFNMPSKKANKSWSLKKFFRKF